MAASGLRTEVIIILSFMPAHSDRKDNYNTKLVFKLIIVVCLQFLRRKKEGLG